MPSKLPKVNFVLTEEELAMVRQYQNENKIKSLSKAFVELVAKGLDNEERRIAAQEAEKVKKPALEGELSDAAIRMIETFRKIPIQEQDFAADLVESVLLCVLRHAPIPTEARAVVPVETDH